MEYGGTLSSHFKVDPMRVEPKPLHMQASFKCEGMGMISMYYSMCSSGFVVPS